MELNEMPVPKKLEEVFNRAKKMFESTQDRLTITINHHTGAYHVDLSMRGEEDLSINHLYTGAKRDVEIFLTGFSYSSSIISDLKSKE